MLNPRHLFSLSLAILCVGIIVAGQTSRVDAETRLAIATQPSASISPSSTPKAKTTLKVKTYLGGTENDPLPLSGVNIFDISQTPKVQLGVTDANGELLVNDIDVGEKTIQAGGGDGYQSPTQLIILKAPPAESENKLEFYVTVAEEDMVYGNIRTTGAVQPIAGVLVRAVADDGSVANIDVTDENGNYLMIGGFKQDVYYSLDIAAERKLNASSRQKSTDKWKYTSTQSEKVRRDQSLTRLSTFGDVTIQVVESTTNRELLNKKITVKSTNPTIVPVQGWSPSEFTLESDNCYRAIVQISEGDPRDTAEKKFCVNRGEYGKRVIIFLRDRECIKKPQAYIQRWYLCGASAKTLETNQALKTKFTPYFQAIDAALQSNRSITNVDGPSSFQLVIQSINPKHAAEYDHGVSERLGMGNHGEVFFSCPAEGVADFEPAPGAETIDFDSNYLMGTTITNAVGTIRHEFGHLKDFRYSRTVSPVYLDWASDNDVCWGFVSEKLHTSFNDAYKIMKTKYKKEFVEALDETNSRYGNQDTGYDQGAPNVVEAFAISYDIGTFHGAAFNRLTDTYAPEPKRLLRRMIEDARFNSRPRDFIFPWQ